MSAHKCAQCGLVNFATATQCKRCGLLFVKDVSSAPGENLKGFVLEDGYVLPPPPSMEIPGAGIWRDKSTLVMSREALLPERCVKCNAFTNGRMTRKLTWHHPAIYLLLFVALLAYLIVALILRKKATVEIGLCERHRSKRRQGILITWLLFLLSVVGFIIAIAAGEGTYALSGLLLLIGAVIYELVVVRIAPPSKIDDRFVWLNGFNSDYLNQFPQWPGV